MRIGLFDVDSHNFPNLPLMKLSAWHKSRGDTVEWWDPDDGHYSIVYASKVFTESVLPAITNADTVHIGGSGIDLKNKLPYEIEHTTPDYSLYPDPTAYNALRPIMQEDAALEGKVNFLIKVLKFIIAESGFELLARIEIKDKKTGRCFR